MLQGLYLFFHFLVFSDNFLVVLEALVLLKDVIGPFTVLTANLTVARGIFEEVVIELIDL